MMQRRTAVLSLTGAALLTACGGGGTDRTKAQVRLVNASAGYETLELHVDDELRQGGVARNGNAAYVEAEPGKAFSIRSPASPTSLRTFTPSVSARRYYTVVAYGAAGALQHVVLDDNNGEPDNNRTLIRVLNAAPDAGALDVYVTNASDPLTTAVPLQANAAVDAVGAYYTITSGVWRIRVTGVNSKTDLRLDVPAIDLQSRQVLTLVLVPAAGGVLLQSLLLNQQGGIAAQAATLARVRAASGVLNVSVRVGVVANAETVLPAVGAAAVSAGYAVLASGVQPVTVTVAGNPLTVPSKDLSPGRDYTLLVHGTTAAPAVAWVDDDNRLPLDRTKARVRLVNGAADPAAVLSLSIEQALLASGVPIGMASGYADLDPIPNAVVEVASTTPATPLRSIDRPFVAAASYSVFQLGAATLVVRRDR